MLLYMAGADKVETSSLLQIFQYPARLCSYFYLRDYKPERLQAIMDTANDGAEWIMDSGLYSYMFGAERGKLKTYEDYRAYAEQYVEFVARTGWKHAIVECDVQKVLSVDDCMRLREDVLDKVPNDVIYVWHIPEKEDGLRELARTRKRIALSVPELRSVIPGEVRKALIRLIRIAREAGPAKIHLLGCTQPSLLDLPADSGDSTSWMAPGSWGKLQLPIGGRFEAISVHSPRFEHWLKFLMSRPRWAEKFETVDAWVRSRRESGSDSETAAIRYQRLNACGIISMWMMMEHYNHE